MLCIRHTIWRKALAVFFQKYPNDFGRNLIFQGIDKFIKQVDEYMQKY